MDEINRPLTICGHCGGNGRVKLPDHLWRTLLCLYTETPQTTPEIVDELAIKYNDYVTIPALCNRLKILEGIGCAVKSKTVAPSGGCWYLWTAKEQIAK